MVTVEELKEIYLLQRLTDEMIERIVPYVKEVQYETGQIIIKQGQEAKIFYMLRRGKVILEVDAAPNITISLGSVKPGYSFGWSGLLPGSSGYTSSALAVEHCDIFTIKGGRLMSMLADDRDMGFRLMAGVSAILENRLERRTIQLVRALTKEMNKDGIG